MRIGLERGDKVTLLPTHLLMSVFQNRNFFSDDETRQKFADRIGGKEGIVSGIEDKYSYDYFYFIADGDTQSYSIPYQSVNFEIELKKSHLI